MTPVQPKSPTPSAAELGARASSSLRALACLLSATVLLGYWLESHAHILLFVGLETLLGWCALGAIAQVAGGNRGVVRQCAFLVGGLVLFAWIVYPVWRIALPLSLVPAATLKSFAILLLGAAALLHFFANYAKLVLGPDARHLLTPSLPLARVASISCALTSAVIFLALSTTQNFSDGLGYGFVGVALLLLVEALLRLAARFYQPRSHREALKSLGASIFFDVLGGSGRGMRDLAGGIEKLFGVKLGEFWMVRFLSESAEAMVLAGVILAWLSTCLTAVPLGSRGVLVSFGQYASDALPPGLHLTLPWPLQEIALVPTEQIREVSLGFDQDMSGPVLWTQKHYVGEQNLLVGDGESLLTIDVPIDYQVSNPVAFLTATSDPAAALKSIAQRDLIRTAQSLESFQIMTVDRAQIAAQLKESLQQDVDRLHLGLRIVFVGLKDVHPPVDVAPAYEKVISAEESKESAIDLANAYEADVLPEAQSEANRLSSDATAAATQRLDLVTGESHRFTLLASAESEAPALFHTRWRYDALNDGLSAPNKIIVGLSGNAAPGTYLDLRGARDNTPPTTTSTQPSPTPAPERSFPKEVTEH